MSRSTDDDDDDHNDDDDDEYGTIKPADGVGEQQVSD